jgi:hypothetical protein
VSGLLDFPNPVNEKAARAVAAMVLVVCLVALATSALWLLVPLAVGFLLRVASGPRFSPFGLLATKVAAPRLGEPRYVPGPPKRFAQGIGLTLTTVGAVLAVGLGIDPAGYAVLGAMVVATGFESIAGLCLGCELFAVLMRVGLVPEKTCEACAIAQ